MKNNIKGYKLVEKGLSAKTVSKLTETQIETLYKKIFLSEQVTEVPNKKTYKVGPKGGKVGNVVVSQDPNTKEVMVTTETEMTEDEENPMNFEKGQRTQDPHQVGPSTDDGFGNYGDGTGEFNEEKKNPWAICTAQLGKEFKTSERSQWSPKQKAKYERCVKDVKKSLKENKNPVSLFLENQIMKIVEKNIPPRITKRDLIKYLTEAGPATAPSKPATKPTTKPTTKPGTKPSVRPSHPGKNPSPNVKPAPKAISPEKAKDDVISLIMNLLEK